MKKTLAFLCLVIISLYTSGQNTFHSEYFDGQTEQGTAGSNTTTDLSDVICIDISDTNLNTNYRFNARIVKRDPIFRTRKFSSSIRLSPIVNISAYTGITLIPKLQSSLKFK